MAQIFYLISGSAGQTPTGSIMQPFRGLAAVSTTTGCSGSDLFLQATNTSYTTLMVWMSQPLSACTLSGSATMSIWGAESNTNLNASCGFRLWHKSASVSGSGAETALMTTVASSSSEFSGTQQKIMSASFTTTTFARDDRLVVRIYATGIAGAAMGGASGRTCTLSYNSPTAGINGDTYIQFSQNVPLKKKVITT